MIAAAQSNDSHANGIYPIKIVVRRTGLTAHAIRMWEKRYGAVTPQRTDTNRRLYSEQDIARLQTLQRATKLGHSIGQIAHLSTVALEGFIVDNDKSRTASVAPITSIGPSVWVAGCLESIKQLDSRGLETALKRATVDLSHHQLIENVICPLMQAIGQLWHEGRLRISHERLASATICSFLGSQQNFHQLPDTAPGIVVTTPAGQNHEIGALLVAHLIAPTGWRPIYLGSNVPAEEIAHTVGQNGAQALALSIVYPSDDAHLGDELLKMRRYIGRDIRILVGGAASGSYQGYLDQIGATILSDFTQLRAELDALRLAN